MIESQHQNSEPDDEADKLIPTNMDEAFAVDGARRALDGTWNPDDPAWKEEYEAHRLMMEAGLTEPAVNLDKVRQAVADIDEARNAVDEAFGDQENDPKSN